MISLTDRIQQRLGVNRWMARYVVTSFVMWAVIVVAAASRIGQLERVAVLAVFGFALVLCSRWPMVPLFLFVALIPIETGAVGELGTASRLVGILFAAAYGVPRIGRLTLQAVPAPGWLFFGWALLSLTWALDPTVAATALGTLAQMFLIMVLVADVVVHRPSIVRPLLWAYSLSAAVSALIGIDAYLTGQAYAGRAAAFATQDVAQFAAILLPALVFSLYELLRGRLIPISAAVAAATTAGIIVSGTRGAWLSAIVVTVVFVLPRIRLEARVAAVGVISLLLVISFQLPGVADLISNRASTAVSTGGAGRTDIWSVGLNIIESSPIVGVGYGNFPVAFTPEKIQESDVGRYLANDPSARGPHSIVVGTVAELGLVGMIPLVLFILPFVFRRGWGPDAAVVQAALVSLLISSLFLDILNRKQLWLMIGMAAGLAYLAAQERARDRAATVKRPGASAIPVSPVLRAPAAPRLSLDLEPPR